MKYFQKRLLVALALVAPAVVACSNDSGERSVHGAGGQPEAVVLMNAMETYASATFDDWAKNSDAVVLLSVTSESRVEPDEDPTKPRRYPISRNVTVEVSEVYWQRSQRAVPESLEMAAWGWMALEDGTERPAVAPGASRLQEGHVYLVALDWSEPVEAPDPEDADAGGGWTVLGSGSTLPADGVVGVGEKEGRLVEKPGERLEESVTVAQAVAGLPPEEAGRLIGRLLGQAVPSSSWSPNSFLGESPR